MISSALQLMGMQLLLPRNKVWLIEEEEEEIVCSVQSPAEKKNPRGKKRA